MGVEIPARMKTIENLTLSVFCIKNLLPSTADAEMLVPFFPLELLSVCDKTNHSLTHA